jgi:hypothetical protein
MKKATYCRLLLLLQSPGWGDNAFSHSCLAAAQDLPRSLRSSCEVFHLPWRGIKGVEYKDVHQLGRMRLALLR